ncbi:MAG TPA: N-acetylmuramoyl-L-alanine amidase [Terriglobales bacterium]|nr:N-acetylmuramoyl-L-alanine amidase [Terriglobales bacterium]
MLLIAGSLCALLIGASNADEKRVSIYSPVARYSLNVISRDGRDYVGLLEILEPLGAVSAKTEGQKWQLKFNKVDAQFINGNNHGRILGRDAELNSKFILENDRGLVPLDSLVTLLPRFLGIPVVFHTTARRLFIGENGTTYTAQLSGTAPALVLNFTSPVNPSIATEPGKLRMVFTRDPVVASGPQVVTFNDKAISSATFDESNGAAAITLSGNVPLLASFGNDGRTITITPAPTRTPTTQAQAPVPSTSAPPAQATPASPATAQSGTARQVFAVIDASHGGTDRGVTFNAQLFEKDITLAFARSMRQEFEAKAMPALLLRDSDAAMTTDQRAAQANMLHPAVYIVIHAASDGNGVRVYTAALSNESGSKGIFIPWATAQAGLLATSQAIASSMSAEIGKRVPVRVLSAPLRPLNNLVTTAVAIEISPRKDDFNDLTAADYQQEIAGSVATAVQAMKERLEAAR